MILIHSFIVWGLFALAFLGLIATLTLLLGKTSKSRQRKRRPSKILVHSLPFLIPLLLFILFSSLHNWFWNVHFWINEGAWNFQYLPIKGSYQIWVDESLETASLIQEGNKRTPLISEILQYDHRDGYLAGNYLFEKPKQRYKATRWFIFNLCTGEKKVYINEETFLEAVRKTEIESFELQAIEQHLNDYWKKE